MQIDPIKHNDRTIHCNADKRLFSKSEAIDCVKDGVLTVPADKTAMDTDFAFFAVREDLPKVQTLKIPASVIVIPTMRGDESSGPFGYENNPFAGIIVEKKNLCCRSQDGVLFPKNMERLICYPCGRPDREYHILQGGRSIFQAFFGGGCSTDRRSR